MTVNVRPATFADANAIAAVHVQSARETYAGLIPDDRFSSLEEREAAWASTLLGTQVIVFVAEVEDQVVGFVSGAPMAADPTVEGLDYDAYLSNLYIIKRFHGRGIGRALLSALAQQLQVYGMRSLALQVLSDNPARAFYERLGATLVTELPPKADEPGRSGYAWRDISVLSSCLSI